VIVIVVSAGRDHIFFPDLYAAPSHLVVYKKSGVGHRIKSTWIRTNYLCMPNQVIWCAATVDERTVAWMTGLPAWRMSVITIVAESTFPLVVTTCARTAVSGLARSLYAAPSHWRCHMRMTAVNLTDIHNGAVVRY
jgi:hypothetical protein